MRSRRALLTFVVALMLSSASEAQTRRFLPNDLFRYEHVTGIVWAPNAARAAVEIHRPRGFVGSTVSSADIAIIDAATAKLRIIATPTSEILGFFNAVWSPDSRRLLFFSIGRDGTIRPWVWNVGSSAPVQFRDLFISDALLDPARALWIDPDHVVLMVRDPSRPNSGPLYFAVTRGRNVADETQKARAGVEPAVSVFDAMAPTDLDRGRRVRLISLNIKTRATRTLVEGALHAPKLSADGRTLSYRVEHPVIPLAPATSFFVPEANGDAAYDRVNWGNETRVIDTHSATPVSASTAESKPPEPSGHPTLKVVNTAEIGTTLVLTRAGHHDAVIWRGNAWTREIRTGRAESISYTGADGKPLTGWLLYPPDYVAGRKLPIITIVYPGTIYSERTPRAFDIFNASFEHPQLFGAMGYCVLLPSMPQSDTPMRVDSIAALAGNVVPLVDAVIGRGVADPKRVAVLGQSAGGWATLGLIETTDRFRSAIASASYSNLVSLYGTFYGQYRYGDAGLAERAQLLRMLQFERGFYAAEAPPWQEPERYRINSPLWRAASVHTPLIMIHGDKDFIPIQQAEEFFTALARQDKRVELVRYAGEEHTITARANVLDMWRRIEAWLRETMKP